MNKKDEKRQHFRVDLIKEVPAFAKIYSVNNRQVEIDKTIPVSMLDLSAGGMRVRIPFDLPTGIIILNVKFEFEDDQYNVRALVLRKVCNGGDYEYGLKFLTSADQASIIRCLNMYKIKNTKFRKVELDLKTKKYIGCFVRFLELIDKPAYLMTDYRLIVASNLLAQEQGIKLGERCYKTIFNEDTVCPHCRMDNAVKEEQIIESDALINGSKCKARWLYTEDGLIIHYFS